MNFFSEIGNNLMRALGTKNMFFCNARANDKKHNGLTHLEYVPFNVSRIFQRDAFAFIPFESLHIAFQKLIRNWLICHVRSKSSKRVDRANINIMQEVISMWIPKYRAEDAK